MDELEDLANNHSVDDNVWSKESFIQGYNKSQETHPYSEEDMIEFSKWRVIYEEENPMNVKHSKKLLQMWREQQPKIINFK
jgi:hypothetical protein